MADEGIFLPLGVEDQFSDPMKSMSDAAKNMGDALREMGKGADESGKKITETEKITNHWADALKNVGAGLIKIRDYNLKDFYRTFRNLSVLGISVGEMFREGIKENMEYDKTLIRMKYSGDLAAGELRDLGSAAKNMAAGGNFSRSEFLKSELALKNLGATSKQAMELAGTSSAFAITNSKKLSEAVLSSGKIAKLYYGDINRISDAQNIMSLTSAKTNIPIDELSRTLEGLGSIIGPSGAKFEDITTMLTIMSKAGMSASEAQSAVRMSMNKAAAVGINYSRALQLVRTRYQQAVSDGERMEVLSANFGARSLKLGDYLKANSKELAQIGDSYKNAAVEAGNLNQEMADLPQNKIAQFHNQLNESFATLAQPLTTLLSWGTKFLVVIGKIPGLLTTIVGAISAFAVSGWIGHTIAGITKLGPLLTKLFPAFTKFLPVFGLWAGRISLIFGTLYAIVQVVRLIGQAWDGLALKFGKSGNDFLTPYAKQKLAQQKNSVTGSAFQVPSPKNSIINQNTSQSSNGVNIHGDLNIHVLAKDAGSRDSLVKSIHEQLRAKGR